MTRTAFLVDGFNLYHSLRSASRALGGAGTRWLDLRSLCRSFLSRIGGDAQLESVAYFSALAKHLEVLSPDTTRRHETYLDCLRESGIHVELAHFKRKPFRCPHCSGRIVRHEEKETDVAIASTLLELLHSNRCDAAVLVTGDSDMTPAIRTANRLFPGKRVLSCFPFDRVSEELKLVAAGHFKIGASHYLRYQFPDPFVTESGRAIVRPSSW